MNSKEFLNKIIDFSKEQINYYENKIAEDEKYPSLQQCHQEELKSAQEGLNHFLKIKQDLDRLEQLEKENQELRKEKDFAWEKSRENWAKYQKECEDVSELLLCIEKKNGELSRHEKAWDILKDKFEIIAVKEDYDGEYIIETSTYFLYINQKQCELLKEVLQDE